MKAILGRKIGMSQVFSPEGEMIPVTIIQAEPNVVGARRTTEKDGYAATQLALPKKKEGQFFIHREFKGELGADLTQATVGQFAPGDVVQISGVSKGKGFQGVVKRHHFKGGPASHGHTDWERRPGSIGQRFPQHTLKGKRMAARMGSDRVTIKEVRVITVNPEMNLLAIKGPVPGRRGTIIEIYGD